MGSDPQPIDRKGIVTFTLCLIHGRGGNIETFIDGDGGGDDGSVAILELYPISRCIILSFLCRQGSDVALQLDVLTITICSTLSPGLLVWYKSPLLAKLFALDT